MRTLSRPVTQSLCILVGSLPFLESATADTKAAPESEHYVRGKASRDGIGKFYMGREISQVMGHLGASWLERPKREKEERTDLLIKIMGLKPQDRVADIGAGSGTSLSAWPPWSLRGKFTQLISLPRCLASYDPESDKIRFPT